MTFLNANATFLHINETHASEDNFRELEDISKGKRATMILGRFKAMTDSADWDTVAYIQLIYIWESRLKTATRLNPS